MPVAKQLKFTIFQKSRLPGTNLKPGPPMLAELGLLSGSSSSAGLTLGLGTDLAYSSAFKQKHKCMYRICTQKCIQRMRSVMCAAEPLLFTAVLSKHLIFLTQLHSTNFHLLIVLFRIYFTSST